MARIRPNSNPNQPIPNTSFSSPLNLYVDGPYFPVVMGSGIDISTGEKISNLNNEGVLDLSGATGDINLLAGTGISIVETPTATGTDFTVNNDGVVQLIAGGNVTITGSNGIYTISASDAQTGTVTSVGTGVGLTGGPITTSGVISLDSSGVTPGSYTYADITVDAYGRLTAASDGVTPVTGITGTAPVQVTGSAPNLTVAVAASSTAAPGIVQLNDSLSSSSTTEALTANQGRILQDQVNALATASNLTFAGTIDASTGNLVSVTTEGAAIGFAVGSPLPASAVGNEDYFVIVTTGGTMTPPGGSAQACDQGDWWLSSGTGWEFLNVGFDVATASTTVPGIVQLATDAEVQAGTESTHAVTSSALQSKVSDSVSTASSTSIASSQAVKDAYDAATAAQTDATQALSDAAAAQATADAALPLSGGTMTGVINFAPGQTVPVGSIQDGTLTQKGVVQLEDSVSSTSTTTAATPNSVKQAYDAATAAQTDATQALSDASAAQTDATQALADASAAQADATQALSDSAAAQADATQALSDAAAAQADATQALADAAAAGADVGDLSTLTTTDKSSAVAAINEVDANADQALADAAAAQATADAAIPCAALTAKGDIIGASAAGTPSALSVGTNGQILYANSACATGLCWGAAPSVPQATPSTLGTLKGCTIGDGFSAAMTALGCDALLQGASALNNVGVGFQTMCSLTSGINNTAVGDFAGNALNGSNNTVAGFLALRVASSAACNVAVGVRSGNSLTTGNKNVLLGYCAGNNVSTGSCNVILGPNAQPPANGDCQLAIGFSTTANWLTGDSTKAIKPGAGIIDCAGSCGTAGQVLSSNGSNAIEWITAGGGGSSATPAAEGLVLGLTDNATTFNTALGCDALNTTSTGAANLALGYFAGNALTSGTANTYVGAAAGCAALDGTFNIGVGYQALSGLTTGANNLAIGALAGSTLTTESFNTVVGGHPGLTGVNNHLILADGQGTLRAVINNCGALAPNATDFGTAGQVLTSAGSGSNFYWATPSGGDSPVTTYNQLINVTAGTAASVIGWEAERGTYSGYLQTGNISAMLFITANNGGGGTNVVAWAQIMLNGWQGTSLSQVIASDTTGGTFSIASVIYPAYSDTTVQFTSNTTDSPMLFNISLNWFGGFRYPPTIYGTAAT